MRRGASRRFHRGRDVSAGPLPGLAGVRLRPRSLGIRVTEDSLARRRRRDPRRGTDPGRRRGVRMEVSSTVCGGRPATLNNDHRRRMSGPVVVECSANAVAVPRGSARLGGHAAHVRGSRARRGAFGVPAERPRRVRGEASSNFRYRSTSRTPTGAAAGESHQPRRA